MKRKATNGTPDRTFIYFFWTPCHICKNEYKGVYMWRGPVSPKTSRGHTYAYVCDECTPTQEDAVRYFKTQSTIPTYSYYGECKPEPIQITEDFKDTLMITASEIFLIKPYPKNWSEMESEELAAFAKEHAWQPFEGYPGEDILEEIDKCYDYLKRKLTDFGFIKE